jgi:hypothetical protein
MTEVTQIMNTIKEGDPAAVDKLLPLVHGAYIRLIEVENQHWEGCGHFFTAAAEAMR